MMNELATASDMDAATITVRNNPLPRERWAWVSDIKYEKICDRSAKESREKWGKLWYKIPFMQRVRTDKGYFLEWEIIQGRVHWYLLGWSPIRMSLEAKQ